MKSLAAIPPANSDELQKFTGRFENHKSSIINK